MSDEPEYPTSNASMYVKATKNLTRRERRDVHLFLRPLFEALLHNDTTRSDAMNFIRQQRRNLPLSITSIRPYSDESENGSEGSGSRNGDQSDNGNLDGNGVENNDDENGNTKDKGVEERGKKLAASNEREKVGKRGASAINRKITRRKRSDSDEDYNPANDGSAAKKGRAKRRKNRGWSRGKKRQNRINNNNSKTKPAQMGKNEAGNCVESDADNGNAGTDNPVGCETIPVTTSAARSDKVPVENAPSSDDMSERDTDSDEEELLSINSDNEPSPDEGDTAATSNRDASPKKSTNDKQNPQATGNQSQHDTSISSSDEDSDGSDCSPPRNLLQTDTEENMETESTEITSATNDLQEDLADSSGSEGIDCSPPHSQEALADSSGSEGSDCSPPHSQEALAESSGSDESSGLECSPPSMSPSQVTTSSTNNLQSDTIERRSRKDDYTDRHIDRNETRKDRNSSSESGSDCSPPRKEEDKDTGTDDELSRNKRTAKSPSPQPSTSRGASKIQCQPSPMPSTSSKSTKTTTTNDKTKTSKTNAKNQRSSNQKKQNVKNIKHLELVPCTKCDRKVTRKNMPRHLQVTHGQTEEFECDECGAVIRRLDNFLRHKKTHQHEHTMECPFCKENKVKSFMKQHMEKCKMNPNNQK